MTRQEITDALALALRQVQENAGQPQPVLDDNTSPLEDLPGFDTPQELDVIMLLQEILGVDLDKVERLFHGATGCLTIGQTVEMLAEVLGVGIQSHG